MDGVERDRCLNLILSQRVPRWPGRSGLAEAKLPVRTNLNYIAIDEEMA
jgi:hypothetical protein